MSRRLISSIFAVIAALSLTACVPGGKTENKQLESTSSKITKQQAEGTSNAVNNTGISIDNSTGSIKSSSDKSSSDSFLDDLTKSITDMGGALGSMDDAEDEDLYVPPPQ